LPQRPRQADREPERYAGPCTDRVPDHHAPDRDAEVLQKLPVEEDFPELCEHHGSRWQKDRLDESKTYDCLPEEEHGHDRTEVQRDGTPSLGAHVGWMGHGSARSSVAGAVSASWGAGRDDRVSNSAFIDDHAWSAMA